MAVVELRNIVKSYDGEPALKGISFEARDGEFFVLLGPSGAGKTTTLKVIAGLEDIDSGDVLIDGNVVTSVPTNLRGVGMAFESYALYSHFTVFENIANPLRAPGKNMPEAEISERVTNIAKLLKIDHLLDGRPGELSGGQKQRVALGRTMVGEPSIYLLDEPLTHVDAKIRFDLRIQFHRFEELQSSTTIYVTHDYVEALSLGHRIGILDEGQLIQIGTPKEIFYTPRNMFVAHLVGQPPINFLEATLHTNNGAQALHFPKGNFSYPLSPQYVKALEKAHAPRDLMVGIRPADIHLAASPKEAPVTAVCDVFEPLGSVGLLSAMVNDDLNLDILVDPESSLTPDMQLGLNFREDRFIFFDPATENNLLWSKS